VNVTFYATLRRVVGTKSVEFQLPAGATLRQLLEEMLRCYPALRPELLDANGDLYQHVHIFVNGRDAPFLENTLDTPLSPEDAVGVFPAVGGG
jgi:molybdopterin synthase sulfur carrier subunit